MPTTRAIATLITAVPILGLDVPAFPEWVAEMRAVPGATAVTTPELETVTMVESELVQLKSPAIGRPDSSVAVAASWTVALGSSVTLS